MTPYGFVVALVGAESTGKTTLAGELREALAAQGRNVIVVAEYLREFCDRHQRTPSRGEQRQIANEQSRRIDAAAADHEIVVADTTALMTAVYGDQRFGDVSLYGDAFVAHHRCGLTLLTAPDLPWRADGHQRDGPKMRAVIGARLRVALLRSATPFSEVCGAGAQRIETALAAVLGARLR